MGAKSDAVQYALVVGNGRSGTNWLLTMLNASPRTHCRNEPQHISSSPFHQLPSPFEFAASAPEVDQKWDEFIQWTATHMGERDHHITTPKTFIHPMAQKLGLTNWTTRPKIRSGLRLLLPSLRQGEWEIPWWVGSQSKINQAYGVLKINDIPAWIVRWVLDNRPQVPIVHIIRHPGGQLHSGISRFFSKLSPDELLQERELYRSILKVAQQIDPHWADSFGKIDSMSLDEAVCWFWCYNNQEIHMAGKNRHNYKSIVYEELVKNPLEGAKSIYDFCNLPWDREVETQIRSGLNTSVWGRISSPKSAITQSWRKKLSSENREIISRILSHSYMEAWW